MKKIYSVLLLAFLLLQSAFSMAVLSEGEMKIFAVTTDGKGLTATLELEIEQGSGRIWSAVTPLVGTTTQNAEKSAVEVAGSFYKPYKNYDYKFTINSPASVVEGPSAGASMALLTISMLTDRKLPQTVSMTGTIREDGSVGPVGGVFEKSREAAASGVKLFLIPRGEAVQTVKLDDSVKSVNLLEYAPATWGMKVAEVETIEDAVSLAFSDIEAIDVNTTAAQSIPDFVPKKIGVASNLGSFKIMTTNYIAETKQITGEARNSLSSSLLEDPQAVQFLLQVLNDAEQTLSRAEILNEQNYLYSAANFAFLARVNAIMVKEISSNPAVLERNSSALDLKILELQREINTFESQLGGNIPKEGAEWFASSQQRFIYAKDTVEILVSEQVIVVDGSEEDELALSFERLSDYAFAVSWLDVSKDFYNLSLESTGRAAPSDAFSEEMDSDITSAQNTLVEITNEEDGREDIQRRIDSAIRAKERSWFEASWLDAASAKALIEAELVTGDKGNEELRELLSQKIGAMEKKIGDSQTKVAWSVLYLDHARYFLESADYYLENDLEVSASGNLRSGISLVYLSEEIFDASSSIVSLYSELPEVEDQVPFTQAIETMQVSEGDGFLLAGGFLFSIALALVLLLLLVGAMHTSGSRIVSISRELEILRQKVREADKKLLVGDIGAQEHAKLKESYASEVMFLEAERSMRASHILALDSFSSEILAYNQRLKELKRHLKDGDISSEEFERKSREYIDAIGNLKAGLEKESEKIASQKKSLEKVDLDEVGKKGLLPVAFKPKAPKEEKKWPKKKKE
ncbi:MAG: hypothetical protein NUV67_04465 [archaeon]|nr:hypothetical protein [archaeon]